MAVSEAAVCGSDGFVAHVDADLRVTWVNSPNGESSENAGGRRCYEAFHRRTAPCEGCPVKLVFSTGRPQRGESADSDGKARRVSCFPIRNAKGDVTGAVAVHHDIGDPGRPGGRPREDDALYRTLFEHSPYAMMLVDPETLLSVEFNSVALRILGWSREEFARLPVSAQETARSPEQIITHVERVLRDGSDEFETTYRTKDGGFRDCHVNMRSIEVLGRPMILSVIEDITGRKQAEISLSKSESLYRSLVENSPDIIMEIDIDGLILYVNRVLRGARKEDAIGTGLLDYIPRDQHRKVRKSLYRSLVKGKNTTYEVSIITPGGTRWWYTRVLPLKKDGKVNRFVLIVTDTTSNKRAEEALRMSEERYRSLVEHSPLPIFVHRNQRFDYLNPMALKLLGVKNADELLGKSIMDFVHPDDWVRVRNHLQASAKALNEVGQIEFKLLGRDGEAHDVVTSSMAVKHEGGIVKLVILNDVTDRKRAEDALRASEKKYRYLTENMRDAVWMMDMNWRHTYVSPSIESIRGFTVEEILDLPMEKSLPPKSLENAQKLLEYGVSLGPVGPDGRPPTVRFEQEEYRKDGSTVWTEVRASLMWDESGKPVGMMGITMDITERKQAEEALRRSEWQYRNLLDNAPVPIGIHRDGVLIYVNAAAVEGMSASSRDQLVGRHISEFMKPESRDSLAGILDLLKESPEKVRHTEYTLTSFDGRTIDLEATGMTVMFDGQPARMVILHETTGRKRAGGEA